jgi:hypothetical protein
MAATGWPVLATEDRDGDCRGCRRVPCVGSVKCHGGGGGTGTSPHN